MVSEEYSINLKEIAETNLAAKFWGLNQNKFVCFVKFFDFFNKTSRQIRFQIHIFTYFSRKINKLYGPEKYDCFLPQIFCFRLDIPPFPLASTIVTNNNIMIGYYFISFCI